MPGAIHASTMARASDAQIGRGFDDARFFPRRHQPQKCIGQLMKGEELLRRRADDA